MLNIRRLCTTAIAAVALCYFAVAGEAAAPNVTYTATGVFATPPISGLDMLKLAGQPFIVSITASEATKPVKFSKTAAEYQNLPATIVLYGPLFPQGFTFPSSVQLSLKVGSAGQPDLLLLVGSYFFGGIDFTFTGAVAMPNGTITTPAIRPFNAPVTLSPADGRAKYADSTQFTILGFASGTLTTTVPAQ